MPSRSWKRSLSTEEESARFIGLLNQGLRLEYGYIIHYPWLAEGLKDGESRELLLWLVRDSMRHADKIAGIIAALGEEPEWGFEPRPQGSPYEVLKKQIEMEKLVHWLYRQAADLAPQPDWREQLAGVSQDELGHVQALEKVLAGLAPDEG